MAEFLFCWGFFSSFRLPDRDGFCRSLGLRHADVTLAVRMSSDRRVQFAEKDFTFSFVFSFLTVSRNNIFQHVLLSCFGFVFLL